MSKWFRILLILSFVVLLIGTGFLFVQEQDADPILIGNYNAMALVAAVGVLLVSAVKVVQLAAPGWNPPEGFYKKVQGYLVLGFTVLASAVNLLGWGDFTGLALSHVEGIVQGLILIASGIVGLWTLSTGIFEMFARLSDTLPFLKLLGQRNTPQLPRPVSVVGG